MRTVIFNGDWSIGANRNPDDCLHGIYSDVQKCLDAQFFLDPFERQIDHLTLFMQVDNEFCLRGQIVAKRRDAHARFVLGHLPAQNQQNALVGIEHGEHTNLGANDGCSAAGHGVGIASSELDVALGMHHEEGLSQIVDRRRPNEIQITLTHQVTRSCLKREAVQSSGVTGCTTKPFDLVQYLTIIDRCLSDGKEEANYADRTDSF